jgi:hypothetical protein
VAPRPAGRSGTDRDDLRAQAIAWVEHHCAEQGIPVKVSDPLTVGAVAAVLAQGRKTGVNRDGSKRL